MKTARIIRIVLLLGVIFAAGLLTGRWTAPRGPVVIPGPGGVTRTSEEALTRLTRAVALDETQRTAFRPVIESIAEKMAEHPPGSPERMALFQENAPQMKALLRPDQHDEFDRYVETTRRRFEKRQSAPSGR